jgi:hypothetical protein
MKKLLTATAPSKVELGDYGVVRVVRGRHKGKIGYYDDDCSEVGVGHYAIIYFGAPFASPYFLVRHSSLEPCAEPFAPLEEFLRAYPDLAAQHGVHRRPYEGK